MYVISTGKSTILSDFADLETKSIYQHQNADTTDFQFFKDSQVFVEINKKSGLEIMRIKDKNDLETEIQRVRKLKIENAYCVACAKQSFEEIALGLSNGQVRIYNYKDGNMLHRFIGDKQNSVICVDYNASDEYIASVYDNGSINVYGNKTRAKLESFNIDSNSSLVRFHPNKRFHLSIASYNGAVTIYDTSVKRKAFHYVDAHAAPCTDLCMSLATPDTLISIGYDCIINIFDTRRKGRPVKLIENHPLSTIALSDCGKFFCVGNLKGELTCFDIRNTKAQLCVKKVHDGGVNRVAFVPQISKEKAEKVLNQTVETSLTSITQQNSDGNLERLNSERTRFESRKSVLTARGGRDSFYDFLDYQTTKGVEKSSSRLTTGLMSLESFDWEAAPAKPFGENRGSVAYTASNLSPINNSDNDGFNDSQSNTGSFDTKQNSSDYKTPDQILKKSTNIPNAPLREKNSLPNPKAQRVQISEDNIPQFPQDNRCSTSPSSDKENVKKNLGINKQISASTPIGNTVTPIIKINTKEHIADDNGHNGNQNLSLNSISKQIESIRVDMDARLQNLEAQIKFDAERNKWQIFAQSVNLFSEQFKNIEEIRSAMLVLLKSDPFVQDYTRLQEENRKLKDELDRYIRKN